MRSFTSVALAAAAVSVGTARAQSDDNSSGNSTIECVDGLYMLIARGTGEDAGPGETGKVARRIAEKVANSTIVGLDYPASFNGEVGDNNYFDSVEKGYQAMKEGIEAYYEACPDHQMAIFGYSQGAQITSDALCGGSGGWFNRDAPPVDIEIIEKSIASIVLFGDPSYVRDATYSRGTGDRDGLFEREDESLERCEDISSRVVSYCDEGDVYCGTSIFSIDDEVHIGYVDKYGDDVVELVVNAYNHFEPEFAPDVSGLADPNNNENGESGSNADDHKDEDDDSAAVGLVVPSLYAVSMVLVGALLL